MKHSIVLEKGREITAQLVLNCIKRHQSDLPHYQKLADYYDGKQAILDRQKQKDLANEKVVCNHAKHITDTASGYFMGAPVSYKARKNVLSQLDTLTEWLRTADVESEDIELARIASIYGKAFELIYMSDEDSPTPKVHAFTPEEAFVVYDDTVDRKSLFGCVYYPTFSDDGRQSGYAVSWSTPDAVFSAKTTISFSIVGEPEEKLNPFGTVNLIEFQNNSEAVGDFEPVLSLMDAYNTLQSDRINDKEQFVDAILVLKGQILGDDRDEEAEAYQSIKKNRLMMLDAEGDASWLTHSLDESSVEVLRRSIEEDIHKFSGVPCMSDENFAGNASGVAMGYKLLGLEQIVEAKERGFRKGLRQRIALFSAILQIKGFVPVLPSDVEFVFSRNLPANTLEAAQVVSTLNGIVPAETLLSTLPFVTDPVEAVLEIEKQKAEAAKLQQELFAGSAESGNNATESGRVTGDAER